MSRKALLKSLHEHYSAPLATVLKQFRTGAILFATGLAAVLFANASMAPSLLQEVVVLLGLVAGGLGFVWAMMAQVRMLISRILGFFRK